MEQSSSVTFLESITIQVRLKGKSLIMIRIAFIEFENERDAERALKEMDKQQLGKRELNIQV